jgi:hypothetical protein
MNAKKVRTTAMDKGDAVIVYADPEPRKPHKVIVPGAHGFRVEGRVGVVWHSGEGQEWDLYGNARGEKRP